MSRVDVTDAAPPAVGPRPGSRLGPYEIKERIGAGGMGEVWRAHDPRLGRDVAIKVLPGKHDADALRRFDVEARAASALSHPNILTLFDVGSHDGAPYVVCELLEGSSLRARLGAPLPERRVLDWARQIADGLAAAHEKGIVHRDIKPENLFVIADGRVKILDFGLAKLVEAPRAEGVDGTALGAVLGTAPYMSPEQVRGQAVDHRTDLFSFGAVLYEMATGRRAFPGASPADVMSAVLNAEPAPEPTAPPELMRVAARCLEKSPALRFQSARDVGFVLEGLVAPSSRGHLPQPPPRRRWLAALAPAALAAAAGVGVGAVVLRREPRAVAPTFHKLTHRRGAPFGARFAPDGRTILYNGNFNDDEPHLKIQSVRLDSPESRAVPPAAEAVLLSVSRTGELAFLRNGQFGGASVSGLLARVPLEGGAPRDVLDAVEAADWAPDGGLAIVRTVDRVNRLELPLGRVLFETRGWISHPRVSPRGDAIAFMHHPERYDDHGTLMVVDLQARPRALTREYATAQGVAWSTRGEIWFTVSDSVDQSAVRAIGTDGRERSVLVSPGLLVLEDISSDGRVLVQMQSSRRELYARAPGASSERSVAWFEWSTLSDLSLDGRYVLFGDLVKLDGPLDFRVYLRATDGSDAVWLGSGLASSLSPDGGRVLTHDLDRPEIIHVMPTGSGEAATLPPGKLVRRDHAVWFPDGKRILFNGVEEGRRGRVYVEELGGDTRAVSTEGVVIGGARPISTDGKWFVAKDGDEYRIYPVEGGEPRRIEGIDPDERVAQWTADGRLVVFDTQHLPCRVVRFDPATGRREPWLELSPSNEYARRVNRLYLTPDAGAYAYSSQSTVSELYVVEGLR